MTTASVAAPVVTSVGGLETVLQIVPAANSPLKIVEWGISFNGSALAAAFPCDLVETGNIAASVTAYAAADVMVYGDPNAPANTAGAAGIPLNLTGATAFSGYTSTNDGTITTNRVFDLQQVEPIGGYFKQFPLGREPAIKPGNVCRIRCHGDGVTKCLAYLVFEV